MLDAMKPNCQRSHDLIKVAQDVITCERRIRLGSHRDAAHTTTVFLFEDGRPPTSPSGEPFSVETVEERELFALAISILADAVEADAVVYISEAWWSQHCAHCGKSTDSPKGSRCEHCHTEAVAPLASPFGREILLCSLAFRNGRKGRSWVSWIERDASDTITGFVDELTGYVEPLSPGMRFPDYWALAGWVSPHSVLNYPLVAGLQEKQAEPQWIKESGVAEHGKFADQPFVRVDPEMFVKVVKPNAFWGTLDLC